MPPDPVARDARGVPVRAWASATSVAFGLAVLSAVAVPLMGLPDEPAHAVHAAAVVRGELVGQDEVRTDPASGWTRTETSVTLPSAYAALPSIPVCFAFDPRVPAMCAPPVPETAGEATTAVTTVGTYAPAWYAAVGWPSLVLAPPAALVGMRLVASALFAAMVGVAVAGAWRAGGRRWGLVGVALALPPVAVHLAGGINPSGTEIAAAVALWTTSAALARGGIGTADLARWAAAGVAVALTRPLGPALAVGIPLVAVMVLGPARAAAPWRSRRVATAGLTVLAAATVALAWSLWRGTLSAFSGFPAPDATGLAAVRRSVALVPERLTEMVGVLGWSDVALPRLVVAGWLVVVVALVVAAIRVADRTARGWLVALALVVLALPVAADVRSAPRIGFVWQGRYTLPVAAGLPILGGLVLDRAAPRRRWEPTARQAVLLGVAMAHGVAFVAVLRRFRVGTDGSALAAMAQVGGPVGAPGWLVTTLVVVVLGGGLTLAARTEPLRSDVGHPG